MIWESMRNTEDIPCISTPNIMESKSDENLNTNLNQHLMPRHISRRKRRIGGGG